MEVSDATEGGSARNFLATAVLAAALPVGEVGTELDMALHGGWPVRERNLARSWHGREVKEMRSEERLKLLISW